MPQLLAYTCQANDVASVEEKFHIDGKKYLVAPTVAIVEGVMNDILYTGDEINAYIEAWDGRPLIIDHPQRDGEFVSANSPEFLNDIMGFYFNAAYEDNRLKGEWWIDIEKAQKTELGQKVLIALQSGKMLEQSTGLFTDIEDTSGQFDGETYVGIARNIRPDHVAILLEEEGACSIEDGCGTPRVNQDLKNEDELANSKSIVLEIQAITETLKGYSEGLGQFFNKLKLFNSSVEDNVMSREELIAWIQQNSPLPMSAAMLEAASDEDLQAIADSIIPAAEPGALRDKDKDNEDPAVNDEGGETLFTVPTAPTPVPAPVEPQVPVVPATTPEAEVAEEAGRTILASLPPQISDLVSMLSDVGGVGALREVIEEARNTQITQFDALADALVANSNYTKEELKDIPLPTLAKMVANLQLPVVTPQPSFGGRAFGANTQGANDWEEYAGLEEVQ